MLKFIGTLVVLSSVFALGYYIGQRPVSELKKDIIELQHKAAELSLNLINTTQGLERTLKFRRGVVDAKERLLQARSDLMERNYGNATKELAEAAEHLEHAGAVGEEGDKAAQAKALAERIKVAERELAKGRTASRRTLEEIQKELDALLVN